MTVKQLMKKSKTALIRKITKSLRSMPKKKLAMLCYEMTKSKLPRLRTTKKKFSKKQLAARKYFEIEDLRRKPGKRYDTLGRRKPKRKFSAKQLAAQRLFAKRARAGTLRR